MFTSKTEQQILRYRVLLGNGYNTDEKQLLQ